jgi:hypothetical protein
VISIFFRTKISDEKFRKVLRLFCLDIQAKKSITIYSENKEYILTIYPIEYPGNYFTAKYQRQCKRGMVMDTVKLCRAILCRISNSDTIEIQLRYN